MASVVSTLVSQLLYVSLKGRFGKLGKGTGKIDS
jgi:hypothetical protein